MIDFLKKRPIASVLAAVIFVLGVWFFTPGQDRFRSFDPAVVGRDEAGLWRAYYERRHFDLALGAGLDENRDFGLSPWASMRSGFSAAEAARVFQRSRSRAEAQAALPALTEHFRIFAAAAHMRIDTAEAARLELEWWQLRRENVGPRGYARAVAAATAYLYGVPPARLARYAELRVEAMDLRDRKGRSITEADWARISQLLVAAYAELRAQVRA